MRQAFQKSARVLMGSAAALALVAAAEAQDFGGSFGDGSFGDGGGGGVAAEPVTQGGGGGGGDFGGDFGGSFGGGGDAPAASQGPDTRPPEVAGGIPPEGIGPGGGDFGDGGSFSPDVAGGGIVPPEQRPGQPEATIVQPPAVDNQLAAFEMRDFGVPPTNQLRQGDLHGPTPTSLPGAQVVTTMQLAQAMQAGTQMVLIDVLGGDYTLPGAFKAPALASPGNFGDAIQQQAAQWLRQITQGNPTVPIVVYCSDPQCWLSYNGALRTVAAGHTNVYWYRGGVQAWQMAGLPLSVGGF